MVSMPYADEDEGEARDGETVRVPLHMMDAMRRAIATHDFNVNARDHQPHYAQLSDERLVRRAAVRAAWIKQLNDAWRGDAKRRRRDDDDEDDDDDDEVAGAEGQNRTDPDKVGRSAVDAATVRRAAYDAYCSRLREAWRGTEICRRRQISDAAEPDAGNQLLGRHLSAEPVANARAARESSYEEYRRRLGSAWQQGRTDPGRAPTIEEQRERWLGK
jgi:hypothetical protein